jgi:hypothetical protein
MDKNCINKMIFYYSWESSLVPADHFLFSKQLIEKYIIEGILVTEVVPPPKLDVTPSSLDLRMDEHPNPITETPTETKLKLRTAYRARQSTTADGANNAMGCGRAMSNADMAYLPYLQTLASTLSASLLCGPRHARRGGRRPPVPARLHGHGEHVEHRA